MKRRILLAYSGSLEASVAIPWLAETYDADVAAVTLDVGQLQPPEELSARALASGAASAGVIDAREEFARECVLPLLHDGPAAGRRETTALVRPLVARKLVERAAIERPFAVAHASADAAWSRAFASIDAALRVMAPVREWPLHGERLVEYARAHGVPAASPAAGAGVAARNLLVRPPADPSRAPEGDAHVDLTFRDHVPVAINGVAMPAADLIESLSLIAGQYGVGFRDEIQTPAALVLETAYASLRQPAGVVRLKLTRGAHVVLDSQPLLVTCA